MIRDSIYHSLRHSLLVVCINTTKRNGLICGNYDFFENASIKGTIFRMVLLNFYSKCCFILFKYMFCFHGFICCVAFTEIYIGKFRKMIDKYCGNVIFLLVSFPLRNGINPPWGDSIWLVEIHIPSWSCSSETPAPDPSVLGDVQLCFPK